MGNSYLFKKIYLTAWQTYNNSNTHSESINSGKCQLPTIDFADCPLSSQQLLLGRPLNAESSNGVLGILEYWMPVQWSLLVHGLEMALGNGHVPAVFRVFRLPAYIELCCAHNKHKVCSFSSDSA